MLFRLHLFVLAALFVLLAACQAAPPGETATPPLPLPEPTESPPPEPTPEPTGQAAARLRVRHNGGEVVVDRLVVIFPEDRIEFTGLQPGETTEYMDVPNGVYSYAAYNVEIDGQLYEQPVIDWVGEEPVAGQDFTWVLDFEPNRGQFEVVRLVSATIDR